MAKPFVVDHCNAIAWCFLFSGSFWKKYFGAKIKRTNTQKIQRNYRNFFHILNLLDWRFQSITQLPNFQNPIISFNPCKSIVLRRSDQECSIYFLLYFVLINCASFPLSSGKKVSFAISWSVQCCRFWVHTLNCENLTTYVYFSERFILSDSNK